MYCGTSFKHIPLVKPRGLFELAQEHLKQSPLKRHSSKQARVKQLGLGFAFEYNYIGVSKNDPMVEMIKDSIADVGYTHIEGLRLNVFRQKHFIEEHVDTAFPNHDTLIVEFTQDERLLIEGSRPRRDALCILQTPLNALVLEEGTRHSVIARNYPRFSLVCWIR